MTARKSPSDWIMAAFRALALDGPGAIRAEALARALGVSKGSFYWHFENVPALKTAMLAFWQKAATDDIIQELDASDLPADTRLRQLAQIAAEHEAGVVGSRRIEAAIRDWGRYDPEVAKALIQVDSQRLIYVAGLFKELGKGPEYARMFYAGLIGLEALGEQELSDVTPDLCALLEILLAD